MSQFQHLTAFSGKERPFSYRKKKLKKNKFEKSDSADHGNPAPCRGCDRPDQITVPYTICNEKMTPRKQVGNDRGIYKRFTVLSDIVLY